MPTELDLLRARLRLSHARMYLRDLENDANFGRMVDSRGSSFNASRNRWIEIILRITTETKPVIPDATSEVVYRLMIAVPDVALPNELKLTDDELSTIKERLSASEQPS